MKIKLTALLVLITAFLLAHVGKDGGDYALPDIRKTVPMKIGGWSGQNLEPGGAVFEFLDEEELLLRGYKRAGTNEQLSLAVVLTKKRNHIHDPEVCYRGQGIFIKEEQTFPVDENMILKVLKGTKKGRPCDVVYWYSDLERVYPERAVFMKNIVISRLTGRPSKGYALVVIIIPDKIKEETLKKFTRDVNSILINIHK